MRIVVNICRLVVALTLIFSGFVKAIDPLGTQYKIDDYLGARGLLSYVPQWVTLSTSIALSALEFLLGMLLLFAIHRRLVSRLIVTFLGVMSLVTLWIWIADPVKDCGCFGDAIILSNGETLLKNSASSKSAAFAASGESSSVSGASCCHSRGICTTG